MDFGTIEKLVLKYLCGESVNICRLCFASTEEEEYCIKDIVRLQKPYFDESLSFIDMFSALGVALDPSLPIVICRDCSAAIIESFLIKKLCEHSETKWREVITKLDQTLLVSSLEKPDIQCAYLLFEESDSTIYTSKKKCLSLTKSAALSKLKSLKCRSQYVRRKKQKRIKTIESQDVNLDNNKKYEHCEKKNKVRCSQCAKLFSTQYHLEEHAERVHYPKTVQCLKCNQKFGTKKMLKRHERLHHVAAICKLCFVQFPSRNALRSHLDKHDIYKCERCSKVLMSKQTYKLHSKICGNPDRKTSIFSCDICAKSYCRKNSLRTHLKTDHGFGRVFSCSWCSKKYDAMSRLQNHMVKHTRERNFTCEHCGGKFVTKAALVYHTRLHTGEKPFKCDQCDEAFLSASRRMEHKRRKHLPASEECTYCHAKFVRSSILKKHVKRHLDPHSKLYLPSLQMSESLPFVVLGI